MKNCWLLLMIVAVLGVSCSAPVESVEVTPTTGTESLQRDTSPLKEPVSPISPPATPQLESDDDEASLGDLPLLLAERLGVAKETLKLVSAERVTWRDASLGCPQEGMMYAQVITPGWRVVFEDAAGDEYVVHTAENPHKFIVCQQAREDANPEVPAGSESSTAVEVAIKMVMERLNVTVEDVVVTKAESVEWRNSCLGCQVPGQMCLMVITPGYLIVLESGGETFEVHTDRTGKAAIFCDAPSISPAPTDK